MTRQRLAGFDYSHPDVAYLVTACAHSGTTPFTDPRLAEAVVATLDWLREHRRLVVFAYCLMPDHIHFLVRLGEGSPSLSQLLGSFKHHTTREYWKLGNTGMLWQPRFHDRIARSETSARAMAEYVLANPTRAGMVKEGDVWPWRGTPDPL